MRAQFITAGDWPNRCTIRYTDDDSDRVVERDFFAPPSGGYVREDWTNPRQVCERLQGGGATLVWSPASGPLVNLIRREWRARQAAERRRWA